MKPILLSTRSPIRRVSLRRGFLFLWLMLVQICFGLCQTAIAVSPAPDGGYAGNNTAEGTSALFSRTTGINNTAIGFQALYKDTSGSNNTAVGMNALFNNINGNFNLANGVQALFHNTNGSYNMADGIGALFSNTTGSYNVATGVNALFHNTTGAGNTGDGISALFSNNIGNNNTANGFLALTNNTSGSANTANGVQVLNSNTLGNGNTGIGYQALYNNTGSNNIALGASSGGNLTSGDNNIDIGNAGGAGEAGIVRIGTAGIHTDTFPAGKIHVGEDFDAAFTIEPSDGSPNAGYVRFGDNTGWQLHLGRARESSGGVLNTGTTGTIMTLTDNGNVGIGPFPGSTPLDVSGAGLNPATPQGHVVLIHDRDDAKTAGLAIQSSVVTGFSPGFDNFITFFNDNGVSIGSIEGNGSGGVQLGGPGSDYAEYLPKADPAAKIKATEIVGVRDGCIVPRGAEADQYMVVTRQAIVAGNRPSEDAADLAKRSLVAFVGQVPVQVRGSVKSGDFILASEKGDGIGLAMSPASIPASAIQRVVGRAWETSTEKGLKTVNVIVGLYQTNLVVPALKRLERENGELRATAEHQQKEIQILTAQLKEQAAQIQKVSARLELNKSVLQTALNTP